MPTYKRDVVPEAGERRLEAFAAIDDVGSREPSAGQVVERGRQAAADVERFAAGLEVLEDGPEVGARLAELCRSGALAGRQVHDASIVATMLAHGETRLLTANRSDFRRCEPRIEIVGL